MRKTHEVLRLHFDLKLKQRQIARSANLSQSTVHEYLRRFRAAGLSWPLPEQMSEAELEAALFSVDAKPPRTRHATFLTFLTSTKSFRNTSTSPCSCCGKSTQLRIPMAIATVSSATTTSNGNASG